MAETQTQAPPDTTPILPDSKGRNIFNKNDRAAMSNRGKEASYMSRKVREQKTKERNQKISEAFAVKDGREATKAEKVGRGLGEFGTKVVTAFLADYVAETVASPLRILRLRNAMRHDSVSSLTIEYARKMTRVRHGLDTDAREKLASRTRKQAVSRALEMQKVATTREQFHNIADGQKLQLRQTDGAIKDVVLKDGESQEFLEELRTKVLGELLKSGTIRNDEISDVDKELAEEKVREVLKAHSQTPLAEGLGVSSLSEGLLVAAKNLKKRSIEATNTEHLTRAFDQFIEGKLDARARAQLAVLSKFDIPAKAFQAARPVLIGALGLGLAINPPGTLAIVATTLVVTNIHKLWVDRTMRAIDAARGEANIRQEQKWDSSRNILTNIFAASGNLMNVNWEGTNVPRAVITAMASRTGLGVACNAGSFLLGHWFGGTEAGQHITHPSQGSTPDGGNAHTQMADLARGGCFVAGTLILMADGSEKAIELVSIGEMVLSYDEETKAIQAQKVLALQSPVHTHLVELTFSNGKKTRNTPNHRYLTKGKGWASVDPVLTQERDKVDAHKLEVNDSVFAYLDGELAEVEIESITEITQETQTFNLSNIENTHTFFANGIVVHNVKLPKTSVPGGGENDDIFNMKGVTGHTMTTPGSTITPPTSGESPFQQFGDDVRNIVKHFQGAANSDKGNPPPPGSDASHITQAQFDKDLNAFLHDRAASTTDPQAASHLNADVNLLQDDVKAMNAVSQYDHLQSDMNNFLSNVQHGNNTDGDISALKTDAHTWQDLPEVKAAQTAVEDLLNKSNNGELDATHVLSDMQRVQTAINLVQDPHEKALLQADLDHLQAGYASHGDLKGGLDALNNHLVGYGRTQEEFFNERSAEADSVGDIGHAITDKFSAIGNKLDLHNPFDNGGGYAAEHATNTTVPIPTGHHLENLPVSGNQQVNLPAGWHVSGNTILDNHNQPVGTFSIQDGKVTFEPSQYAESTYGIPAGAETFPLEGIGQGPSLAEVGQYNPADWHWDTQIYQPGLFSHNELTMSVDNGVVHYGGNLSGTNIPSHLDNIPIANDPNLQNIAAMNGGHIAPSDMVTAVRLNNGQVVLLPMSPDGSAHLPPELYSNGQLQNLNYISTALVTGKDGHILHMGDLQRGLPDGAKIVSLASNPFQTPTTDAINHLNITGANAGPQIIDLAKVIHTSVEGGGGAGGGGGGLPEVLGHFPGGAAGLAAGGALFAAGFAGGLVGQRQIANGRGGRAVLALGGSGAGGGAALLLAHNPAMLLGVGAGIATGGAVSLVQRVRNRRAGRTPAAAGAAPGAPGANPVATPPGGGVRLGGARVYAGGLHAPQARVAQVRGITRGRGGQLDRGEVGRMAAEVGIQPEQLTGIIEAGGVASPASGVAQTDEVQMNAARDAVSRISALPTGRRVDLTDRNNAELLAMAMPHVPENQVGAVADQIQRVAVVRQAVDAINNVNPRANALQRANEAVKALKTAEANISGNPNADSNPTIVRRQAMLAQAEVNAPSEVREAFRTQGYPSVAQAVVAAEVTVGNPGQKAAAGFREARVFTDPNNIDNTSVANVAIALDEAFDGVWGAGADARRNYIITGIRNVNPALLTIPREARIRGELHGGSRESRMNAALTYYAGIHPLPDRAQLLGTLEELRAMGLDEAEISQGLVDNHIRLTSADRAVLAALGADATQPTPERILAGLNAMAPLPPAVDPLADPAGHARYQGAVDDRVEALLGMRDAIQGATVDSLREAMAQANFSPAQRSGIAQRMLVTLRQPAINMPIDRALDMALAVTGLPDLQAGGITLDPDQVATLYNLAVNLEAYNAGVPATDRIADVPQYLNNRLHLDTAARRQLAEHAAREYVAHPAGGTANCPNMLTALFNFVVSPNASTEQIAEVVGAVAEAATVATNPLILPPDRRDAADINAYLDGLHTPAGAHVFNLEKQAAIISALGDPGGASPAEATMNAIFGRVGFDGDNGVSVVRGLILARQNNDEIRDAMRGVHAAGTGQIDATDLASAASAASQLGVPNEQKAQIIALVASPDPTSANIYDRSRDIVQAMTTGLPRTRRLSRDDARHGMQALGFDPAVQRQIIEGELNVGGFTAHGASGSSDQSLAREVVQRVTEALTYAGYPPVNARNRRTLAGIIRPILETNVGAPYNGFPIIVDRALSNLT